MDAVAENILHVPAWAVYVLVFLIPALEASAFVGFVFPGEIACLLGGVAAFQGNASLTAVIVVAVLGAIIGDSIGYAIGRHRPPLRRHASRPAAPAGHQARSRRSIEGRDQAPRR
jgi:membrane protein DedA with SNARE-associated domain